MKKPNNQQETPGMGLMTILGWVYRTLLALARKSHLQGTQSVNVMGASAAAGTTIVACLGTSATVAKRGYGL